MSRSARSSALVKEEVRSLSLFLVDAGKDGIDDQDFAAIVRRVHKIESGIVRLDSDLAKVDLLIHGKGSDSPWYQRQEKEKARKQKVELRVVVRNNDPDPDGPGGIGKAA